MIMTTCRVRELETSVANMKRQQDQLRRHVKVANEQKTKLEVCAHCQWLYCCFQSILIWLFFCMLYNIVLKPFLLIY